MAKKQDGFYFETFVACAGYACQAAGLLKSTANDFHPETLSACLHEMHTVEHAADSKKHEMIAVLSKAFITPIEREDILELSMKIDDLVDEIEDVLQGMYCHNVQHIRPDALEAIEQLSKTCEAVLEMLKELENFKRSKKLKGYIIAVNTLEGEADMHYVSSLHRLHTESVDPIEILAWHELYGHLEQCFDACEDIADAIESIVMKNA